MAEKAEQLRIASSVETPPDVLAELALSDSEDVRAEVAGNFNTPKDLLAELAKDPAEKVRNYVATNPCTPYEALAWLAASRDEWGWAPAFHLWANPAWPYKDNEILPYWNLGEESLDCDEYFYARDSKSHKALLEYIYINSSMDITLIELAKSPRTPEWCLQEIARAAESEILQAVASNPAIPDDLLIQIADEAIKNQDFCILSEVCRNPKTSIQLLESIFDTFEELLTPGGDLLDPDTLDLLIGMAASPSASLKVLTQISNFLLESLQEDELIEDEDEDEDDEDQHEHGWGTDRYDAEPVRKFTLSPRTVVIELLRNPQMPTALIESLRNFKLDVNASVEIDDQELIDDNSNETLASNPKTSLSKLRELAVDPRSDVRRAVAINPICSEEILAKLFKDEKTEVKIAVLLNSHTPLSILDEAASDGDLKSFVARHPKVTRSILENLIEDEEIKVRDCIAQNLYTPEDILSALAEDQEELVRGSVASNPNVDEETLVNLSLDESQTVRTMAFYNPSASDEIRITAALHGIFEQPVDSHLVQAINFLRSKKKNTNH